MIPGAVHRMWRGTCSQASHRLSSPHVETTGHTRASDWRRGRGALSDYLTPHRIA